MQTVRATSSTATEQEQTEAEPEYKLVANNPAAFRIAKGQLVQLARAALPFLFRLGSGGFVSGYRSGLAKDDGTYGVVKLAGRKVSETTTKIASLPRPKQPLELYEFEGCPFCRKVREAVAILDIDVVFYPCPKGSPTWRSKVQKEGGRALFPYMVDPNTGKAMYESDDIIAYLFQTYGDGQVPLGLRLGFFTVLSCGLALAASAGAGSRYRAAKLPAKHLIYWGYEASPFCKIVREVLCELELPHLQKSVARGSPKRQELFEKRGQFQAPYLEDPNTGVALFESADIIKYLNETYAA
ncbi:hypothetical protein WJX72_003830 [[Myrmecia] bisecta]|uniref:GST N-terminal domain-containing protein n=1 Tax=[Myrmecia] bisecta TaxID=41462 RepID=A0AAW1R6F9_9CHLO